MCLRFQFCTHQRVCILHFLKKKSNSFYPSAYTGTVQYSFNSFYSTIKILCQVKEKIDAVLAERQKLHTAWQHKKVT
jgi:hypothetical protein